jgi:hypothetical protein
MDCPFQSEFYGTFAAWRRLVASTYHLKTASAGTGRRFGGLAVLCAKLNAAWDRTNRERCQLTTIVPTIPE